LPRGRGSGGGGGVIAVVVRHFSNHARARSKKMEILHDKFSVVWVCAHFFFKRDNCRRPRHEARRRTPDLATNRRRSVFIAKEAPI
jgi:hypothetical protein